MTTEECIEKARKIRNSQRQSATRALEPIISALLFYGDREALRIARMTAKEQVPELVGKTEYADDLPRIEKLANELVDTSRQIMSRVYSHTEYRPDSMELSPQLYERLYVYGRCRQAITSNNVRVVRQAIDKSKQGDDYRVKLALLIVDHEEGNLAAAETPEAVEEDPFA